MLFNNDAVVSLGRLLFAAISRDRVPAFVRR